MNAYLFKISVGSLLLALPSIVLVFNVAKNMNQKTDRIKKDVSKKTDEMIKNIQTVREFARGEREIVDFEFNERKVVYF